MFMQNYLIMDPLLIVYVVLLPVLYDCIGINHPSQLILRY